MRTSAAPGWRLAIAITMAMPLKGARRSDSEAVPVLRLSSDSSTTSPKKIGHVRSPDLIRRNAATAAIASAASSGASATISHQVKLNR